MLEDTNKAELHIRTQYYDVTTNRRFKVKGSQHEQLKKVEATIFLE